MSSTRRTTSRIALKRITQSESICTISTSGHAVKYCFKCVERGSRARIRRGVDVQHVRQRILLQHFERLAESRVGAKFFQAPDRTG